MKPHRESHPHDGNEAEPAVVATLRKAVQERRLTKEFLETEEFESILDELRETLRNGAPPDVWSGLSVAGRASSVSNPVETAFSELVEERVKSGLPKFEPPRGAEDRRYLAKILRENITPEVVDIAYSEIVRDELGEKAREIWVDVALSAEESQENFLRNINKSINFHFGDSRERSDALARRIRKINSAARNKLVTSGLPAGSEFSGQLRMLYTGHLSEEGPNDADLRNEMAVELMESLIGIVRLSPSIASAPNSYLIARDMKAWWKPAHPSREFEISSRELVGLGVESLHASARQGIKDDALRKCLSAAGGDRYLATEAQKIIEMDSSMPEEIATWLTTGEAPAERRTFQALEEMVNDDLDTDISWLLIHVGSIYFDTSKMKSISKDVAGLMPDEGDAIEKFAAKGTQISKVVRSLAERHHISLFLEVGDVIEFDPKQHHSIGEGRLGGKAEVVRPGTRKMEPGRPPRIIIHPEVKHQ